MADEPYHADLESSPAGEWLLGRGGTLGFLSVIGVAAGLIGVGGVRAASLTR
jgi:hypothetical protein